MKNNKLIVFVSALNFIVLLLTITASRPATETFDKITVREFELVDEKGKKRVAIKIEPEGGVVFRMMDHSGTIRVKIDAEQEGSGFVLLDENTEPGIHALAKKRGATLSIVDKSGKKKEF